MSKWRILELYNAFQSTTTSPITVILLINDKIKKVENRKNKQKFFYEYGGLLVETYCYNSEYLILCIKSFQEVDSYL